MEEKRGDAVSSCTRVAKRETDNLRAKYFGGEICVKREENMRG